MPARISRGSLQSSKLAKSKPSGRNPKKAQKRALNAFSIASHEHADRVKIRPNRLGESEGFSHRKRPRYEEGDDEDEDEGPTQSKRRKQGSGGAEEESLDEGSDSEGNAWTMGHVDEDDDSDIDSDEAFGESDEEKFEGWTFRGSSHNRKGRKARKPRNMEEMDGEDGEIDLDEGDSADGEEDEEEDDLGEDAIDLATALDQYEESEEEKKEKKAKKSKKRAYAFDDSDEEPSEVGDFAADGASDFSSDEDEDESDRRAQLKDLISSLAEEDEQRSTARNPDTHESAVPSEFGVLRKVDLASFKSKVADPEKKKALKLLQDDKSSKRNDIARKLEAPLPKRQQDKLDRAAASAKTNETLERWVDTVKHNRRAEHLSFPLYQPEAGQRMGETRLLPTTTTAPANDLEVTIQSILQQSGLSNGKDDEEQIQKWEELQTNKLPLQEVMKRRAQLRKERELLFREEVRAKRIKKIKSKSYRRVHRKERERLLQRERDALKADGVDVSEDEQEYNVRRRAEERMGAKHRESKWAKGIKASGRSAWDEDARSGVTEMARRNDELRRRIEGKEVRNEDSDASDLSSDGESELYPDEEDGHLERQLGLLESPFSSTENNSKLSMMAFMRKAEATRKTRNDEDIERMRRELADEESPSEEEGSNAARRGHKKYGPGLISETPSIPIGQSEFEERAPSDEETDDANGTAANGVKTTSDLSLETRNSNEPRNPYSAKSEQNPYLMKASKEKRTRKQPDLVSQAHNTIPAVQEPSKSKTKSKVKSKATSKKSSDSDLPEQIISAPDANGWQTVSYQNQSDEEGGEGSIHLNTSQFELTAKAFAGDDVVAEFEEEKRAVIDEDDEKIEKNVLPGWGSWAGEGLSKKNQKRKGHVTYNKKEGVKPEKRKDAKLDRVIINEKRVKANTKYLASQLPFPFETKEQYERSLRLPKGPEWTTKKTFSEATKPRVLVKQGIIRPLHKPLV